ncbi:hypothetical protein BJ138DRAFT_1073568, partial [Hygrophoropsis aurantiaca]
MCAHISIRCVPCAKISLRWDSHPQTMTSLLLFLVLYHLPMILISLRSLHQLKFPETCSHRTYLWERSPTSMIATPQSRRNRHLRPRMLHSSQKGRKE